MEISLKTLLPGVAPGQIHAHSATSSEVYELVEENLIGENTTALNAMSAGAMDNFRVTQWSEQVNSQWWGLMGEGDAGKEAAGYLEQMTTERRTIANNYLDDFYTLSNTLGDTLQDDYPKSADLDQLMDNVAAGRKPSENADGTTLPKADIIEAFWSDNKAAIDELNGHYDALKEFPQHLSDWLDENKVERSLAVDQAVEKHRFSGMNGSYQAAETLVGSAGYRLNSRTDGSSDATNGELPVMKDIFNMPKSSLSNSEASESLARRMVEVALRVGDAGMLKHAVSSEMMHNERSALLTDYQQQYQALSERFYAEVGELEPRFSVQDLLDNLAAGQNGTLQADGTTHPQAEKITAFINNDSDALSSVSDQQQALDEFPKTRSEWLDNPENSRHAEQIVRDTYGLEPWENGMNSRGLRSSAWMGPDAFQQMSPESRQQAVDQARQRGEHLSDLVTRTLLSNSPSLNEVLDNFRNGRPLGLQSDGSIHPQQAALEQVFRDNEDTFIAHIDSLWMLGQQTNLSMVDYHKWMTSDRVGDFAQELVDLIEQSREAIDFDELALEQEQLLAGIGNQSTSS